MSDTIKFWIKAEHAKQAIERARASRKALMVFVEEKGFASKEFETALCGEKVKEALDLHYVGLRLLKGTSILEQFEQLVPVSCYPSLFSFYDGELLHEINYINEDDEQLAAKLTQHLVPKEQECISPSSEMTLQEKKAMLLARLEEKRKAKEEEKKAEQKLQEANRRAQGRELTNAKLAQQQKESQNIAAALAKEKKEAKEHQLRVREEIARDKAERLARKQAKESTPTNPPHPASLTPPISDATKCRLNMRLSLDGSSYREEFGADEPLSAVRQYVAQNVLPSGEAFDLIQTLPRRKFTAADELQSLRELHLCPSNTLMIQQIPINSGSSYPISGAGVTDTLSAWVDWSTSTFNSFVSYVNSGNAEPQTSSTNSSSSASARRNRITTLSDRSDSNSKPMAYNGNSTNQQ
ncbi:hypothetical protein DSO57_1038716 [Entomophthora muscae]|uniref:Uncharacterized protein n=2 Tax=Entomophthora muscae TaxID=34485 RepID=A0ACC2TSS1_9FUNG|nr:hypothetical protein DSO57_1013826 [Entomophthora muscae]KAJ9083044.1 hypothetical protein DSO57_1038716 [Entomophthora muscae]